MKRTDPIRVGTLLDNVMLSGDTRDTVLEQRASYLWVEVVGPGVNRYTFRRYVDKGVLHVYITSASLKNELSFMRSRIIEQINARVGAPILTDLIIH